MILMGTSSVGVQRLIFLTLLPHNTFDKACFPLPCSGLFVLHNHLNKAFMLSISKVLLTLKYTFWRDFYLGFFCAFVICHTSILADLHFVCKCACL